MAKKNHPAGAPKRHFGAAESALMKACRAGDAVRAQELLAEGADPLALHPDVDAINRTPLGAAARLKRLDCLKMLLPLADLEAEWRLASRGAFSLAAREGFSEGLDVLLAALEPKMAASARVSCAREARAEADALRCLAACGPLDEDHQATALALACQKGFESQALRLLGLGADPTRQDAQGRDCLHLAAMNGHAPICRLLTDRCDPNRRGPNGATALMAAARNGKAAAVAVLLPISDMSAVDAHGETAFSLAHRCPFAADAEAWMAAQGDLALLDFPNRDGVSPRQRAEREELLAPRRLSWQHGFFYQVASAWEARALRGDLSSQGVLAKPKTL